MTNLIAERVRLANEGTNPYVVARLASGWLVIGDVQPLAGYCVLLADPVVESLNALDAEGRARFAHDMGRVGDALMAATGAYRINYEILGNAEPALHAHIVPRYGDEPDAKRRAPPMMAYDWASARRFDPEADGALVARLRAALGT